MPSAHLSEPVVLDANFGGSFRAAFSLQEHNADVGLGLRSMDGLDLDLIRRSFRA